MRHLGAQVCTTATDAASESDGDISAATGAGRGCGVRPDGGRRRSRRIAAMALATAPEEDVAPATVSPTRKSGFRNEKHQKGGGGGVEEEGNAAPESTAASPPAKKARRNNRRMKETGIASRYFRLPTSGQNKTSHPHGEGPEEKTTSDPATAEEKYRGKRKSAENNNCPSDEIGLQAAVTDDDEIAMEINRTSPLTSPPESPEHEMEVMENSEITMKNESSSLSILPEVLASPPHAQAYDRAAETLPLSSCPLNVQEPNIEGKGNPQAPAFEGDESSPLSSPPELPATPPAAASPHKKPRRRTCKTGLTSTHFRPARSPGSTAAKPAAPKPAPFSAHFTLSTYALDLNKSIRRQRQPAWPPLTAPRFGLIQEEFADQPFHLLVATVFLNRTRGAAAVPVFRDFMGAYPSAAAVAAAPAAALEAWFAPLGLQRTRAARLGAMARAWVAAPPAAGVAAVKRGYPAAATRAFPLHVVGDAGGGRGVAPGAAWEIAHIPGVGPYALDSWRIFCRDALRGGVAPGDEEWRRVVPMDKELRACLRWRWSKEGKRWVEEGDMEWEGGMEDDQADDCEVEDGREERLDEREEEGILTE